MSSHKRPTHSDENNEYFEEEISQAKGNKARFTLIKVEFWMPRLHPLNPREVWKCEFCMN